MTSQDDSERVDLGKHGDPNRHGQPDEPLDFDPYRFGLPDRPVPPEFAPPGYRPPAPQPTGTQPPAPPSPYAQPGAAHGQPGPPYGQPGPPYGQYPAGQYPAGQQDGYNAYYGRPGDAGWGPPVSVGKTGRGKAITALVLGIASIVLYWVWIVDVVLVLLAVVFGWVAVRESRRGRAGVDPRTDAERKGARRLATAGLVCALVGAVLATVLTVKVVRALQDCGGLDGVNRDGFQQCLQDNLY